MNKWMNNGHLRSCTHRHMRQATPTRTDLHQRAQLHRRRLRDEGDVVPRELRLVPLQGLSANVLERLQSRVGPQADRTLLEQRVVHLRLRGARDHGRGDYALGELVLEVVEKW